MANLFPSQTILESQKNLEWAKGHFLYAEDLLRNNMNRIARFTKLYNTYNGVVNPKSIEYLTLGPNGKRNKAKYVSYRLSKSKIDLLNNEWLKRPLNSTVTTVNITSKTSKLDHYETVLGAAHAKEAITKLQGAGVDPVDGMAIPDVTDQSYWEKMPFKDKNEAVMQVLINSAIEEMDLKEKFNKNFQDELITAMVFGQNIITIDGDDDYITIDPRDAIYVEIDRDPFMAKSPIMGHRERMTFHDIIRKFTFNELEKEKLEAMRSAAYANPSDVAFRGRYNKIGDDLTIDVIHIEWKSVRPSYTKITSLTASQRAVSPDGADFRSEIDPENYEKNKEFHDKNVKAGRYTIETKYREELWEGWQIGHDIYKDCRRVPFTMRREDAPGDVFGFSYTGLLANTVNGMRISFQELCQAFSDTWDIIQYKITEEIAKASGKVIVYDSAALPRNTTIKDVIYQMRNESFVSINTAAAGNMTNKDIANALGIKEYDLGLSQSFSSLVMAGQQIKAELDSISGVNNDREGFSAASSTATNAQTNISNSRTITENWFYLMSKYVEKVLTKTAQQRKLIWGLYKPEKARIVLGDEKFGFMQATADLAYCDYDVHLSDGSKEIEIRQRVFGMAEASLNAKELRYQDVIKAEMAETLSDSIGILEKGWEAIKAVEQQNASQQQSAAAQMQQQQLQTQIMLQDKARAADEENAKTNILLQGQVDMQVNSAKAKDKVITDTSAIQQDYLHQPEKTSN